MTPIIHRPCGKQVAWFIPDKGEPEDIMKSSESMYLDGSQPKAGDVFHILCDHCNTYVIGVNDLVRKFKSA